MVSAQEIIDMALGTNQGLIDRQKSLNTQQLIKQNLNRPTYQIGGNTSTSSPVGGSVAPPGEGQPYTENEYGLEPTLYNSIQTLNQMSPFGPNTVTIGSGWRSYEEQARLYNDWINGVPGQARAAPPGRSNHNHGTAADLEFASPEAREWVHSVAADLGLHFPVPGENWHIERV